MLHQSLTPRYRGTYLAIHNLHEYLESVYDVTIAYECTRKPGLDGKGFVRTRAPGMIDFILSYSPRLHVNIRKLSIGDLPHEDTQEVTRWLHSCYERKERYAVSLMSGPTSPTEN